MVNTEPESVYLEDMTSTVIDLSNVTSENIRVYYPNATEIRLPKRRINELLIHNSCYLVSMSSDKLMANEVKIHECDNLRDIKAIADVQNVSIVECGVVDLPNFTDLRHLCISFCPIVKLPPGVSNAKTVVLNRCYELEDITALKGVPTVELYRCINLTDISALVDSKNIDITDCEKIVDYSPIRHKKNLTFTVINGKTCGCSYNDCS